MTAYKQKFESLSLAHEHCSELNAGLDRELAEVKRLHAHCDQLVSESRNQVRLCRNGMLVMFARTCLMH